MWGVKSADTCTTKLRMYSKDKEWNLVYLYYMFSLFKCLFLHTCSGTCSSSGQRGSTDKRRIPRWNTPFLFHFHANLMNLVGACSSCSVPCSLSFSRWFDFQNGRKSSEAPGNLAATSMMWKNRSKRILRRYPGELIKTHIVILFSLYFPRHWD